MARPGFPNQTTPQEQQQKLHTFRNFLLVFSPAGPQGVLTSPSSCISSPSLCPIHLPGPWAQCVTPSCCHCSPLPGLSPKDSQMTFLAVAQTPGITAHCGWAQTAVSKISAPFQPMQMLSEAQIYPPPLLLMHSTALQQLFFHCLLKLKSAKLISFDLQGMEGTIYLLLLS